MSLKADHVWAAFHQNLLTIAERDRVLSDLAATRKASHKATPPLQVTFDMPGLPDQTISVNRDEPLHATVRRDVKRECKLKLLIATETGLDALTPRTTPLPSFSLGEIAASHIAGEIDECEFRALTDLYDAAHPGERQQPC